LDDVITTGATMLSCGQSLIEKDVKISVVALAVAN
jgi:predicted amidophosphoribosyltransferase